MPALDLDLQGFATFSAFQLLPPPTGRHRFNCAPGKPGQNKMCTSQQQRQPDVFVPSASPLVRVPTTPTKCLARGTKIYQPARPNCLAPDETSSFFRSVQSFSPRRGSQVDAVRAARVAFCCRKVVTRETWEKPSLWFHRPTGTATPQSHTSRFMQQLPSFPMKISKDGKTLDLTSCTVVLFFI